MDMAEEHCVRDRPHAMLWLFQSYALSGGMYGSQIWSTRHLARLLQNDGYTTDVHTRHVGFVKRVLQVKRPTNNWVILREGGQLPMHFYWLRGIAKFWNAIISACAGAKCYTGLCRQIYSWLR